jgi:flagellar biogenesis protein FliO
MDSMSVLAVMLVLSAAAGATVFLQRWKGSIGRREGPMQLRHVLALGPRERLALVKVGNRYLVVGVTTAGISAVAEFSNTALDERESDTALEERREPPETHRDSGPT